MDVSVASPAEAPRFSEGSLSPFVAAVWTHEGPRRAEQRVLPDGCLDILLFLDEGKAVVVGAMTRAAVVPAGAGRRIVAVRFRPGAAARVLGVPAHELTDLEVDAEALGLRIAVPDTVAAASRTLEVALSKRVRDRRPDPRVAIAVRALWHEEARIAGLAARLGWTRQHLGRVFRDEVGLAPKQLARIGRLQRTLHAMRSLDSLAAVAAEVGYFDEGHMARDFRELAGVTPGVARAGSILPIPPPLPVPSSGHEADHHQPHRRQDRGLPPVLGRPPRLREDRRGP